MTLDIDLIKQIIKDNPNAAEIKIKQELSKTLKAHVTGDNCDELIELIKGFERKELKESRKKMMMSNRDVVERVLQPRERIYTATGGIESYNFTTVEKIKEFKEFLSDITGQMSLKEYIEQVLQPKYDYDPNGLKWVDLNDDNMPYPCFKSIHCIFEMELNGRKPEFVFFICSEKEKRSYIKSGVISNEQSPKNTDKIYRVVCDSWDRIVIVGGGGIDNLIVASEIPNYFGYVPGEVVSDIVGANDDFYDSCLNKILELLAHYMFGRSLFNIALARCAYPKEWMHRFTCPTCQGKKLIDSAPCPECKGTGALPAQQNSDVLIVDYGNDLNKSIPNPPMGTNDPAVEGLIFMRDNPDVIEEKMERTIWGVVTVVNSKGSAGNKINGDTQKTAYEVSVNNEPRMNKLRKFSKWYARSFKWYVDVCAKYMYAKQFISSAILGGEGYMTESPDLLLDKLSAAITAKEPPYVLMSIYTDYVDTKYQNNPLLNRQYKLLKKAEPFPWNIVADVLMWENIPETQKLEKQYFAEWVESLTDLYYASMPDEGAQEKMKEDLTNYVLGKYKAGVENDTLLFSNSGQLLQIGDNAQVRDDKVQDPAHLGKSFKISLVKGRNITLQDGIGDDAKYITGYTISDFVNKAAA